MVKGITLGVVISMLIIGCGGGGGGGGGSSDLCFDISCISHVTDQAEYLAQDGLNDIDAENANLTTATGAEIHVAVVDSGIDSSHIEFNQNTILGTGFANSSVLEIKHKAIKIALGLYDPGHFTQGEVSLLVAKGINEDKQIYYEKESFKLKAERRLAGFLAAKGHFTLNHKQAIGISLSVQQSPYKRTHIEQASLTAAFNF